MHRLFRLAVVFLALWWASSAAFTVDETESVIVTQFGRPVRSVLEAGLHYKYPWPVQSVLRFDNRLQVFETPTPERPNEEYLTRDKKNVLVGTYTAWRIGREASSLDRFLRTVREASRAEVRLADLVVSELGAALGSHPFAALVSTDKEAWAWPQLVEQVAERCRGRAQADYGIEIIDFQISRVSFPNQNRRSVFDRMRAERERIASQYRAEGQEEAVKIRAAARGEEARILAEADEQARRIRGQADAEAARIYGEAYGQDPEFYEFLRTLESYGQAFDEDTIVVLSADSPFLRLIGRATTAPSAARPGPAEAP